MDTNLKSIKKQKFFASKGWYAAAFGIIIWAIFQEIIMASTDIVDNIFVNFIRDLPGLKDLNNDITNSNWSLLTKEQLKAARLTDYFQDGMFYSAGQLSVNGVAASNQIYILMYTILSGFCYGAGIYSAQYFGSGNYEKLRQITTLKFYVALIVTVFFALLGIKGITHHLIWFTTGVPLAEKPEFYLTNASTTEEIQQWFSYFQYEAAKISTQQGEQYYRIVSSSYLLLSINQTAITSLRETRRPFYSFWMSVISLVTNCILNVFLTAPSFLGEFQGLGVLGCAWATFTSRCIQSIFIVTLCAIKRFEFIPNSQSFIIQGKILKNSLGKAMPIVMNELFAATSLILQIKLRASYSVEALTANAIYSTIVMSFFWPLYHGMNAGISAFVGNELGANRLNEAQYNAKHLMFMSLGIGLAFGVILSIASPWIPGLIFTSSNAEAQRIAHFMLLFYGIFYPLITISNACYSTLRTGGAVWNAFIMDGLFTWVIQIPLLATLITLNSNGTIILDIIWMQLALMSTEIIKVFWAYYNYSKKRWVKNLTIDLAKIGFKEEQKTIANKKSAKKVNS
ncbi:MATE family efflux transporter [Spiroplasma alleghenense]|uniref:MATE efflux family protein n=1 Tax=Spiroplasma alleghenense TaxID=216931 RepID=A0A345Z371_9MOLU|nr:MATE family efflux transporter [Spiroplasma alleghenense]AXK51050.1 MATE efflux family protein [Spiroplasma alleghenense]